MARIAIVFVFLVFAALSHGCIPIVIDDINPLKVRKPASLKEYEGKYYNGSNIPLSSLFWSQTETASSGTNELEIQFSPPDSLLVRAFKSSENAVLIKEGIFKEGADFRFVGGFITRPEWEEGYKLGIENSPYRSLVLITGVTHKLLPEGGPHPFIVFEKDVSRIHYARIDGQVFSLPAYQAKTFRTVDEQIDHYLRILSLNDAASKIAMLKQLQWSGLWLSDSRLFDEIERQVVDRYEVTEMSRESRQVLSHQVLALGYSGNEKYRDTLRIVGSNAHSSRVRNYAKNAELQLEKFIVWNRLIADSEYQVQGKPFYIEAYMKMVNADDIFLQRYAARGIFREKLQDPELLSLVAEKLEAMYMQVDLDDVSQETAAWFCKAIGQSGNPEYGELLYKIAQTTPHEKIMNHAKNYAVTYKPEG